MTHILLHDIPSAAQIAPEIAEKFPGAQVLFHVSGNCDVGRLLEDYERTVASQGSKTEIGDDLRKLFSDYGHQILSRIAQNDSDLYFKIIIAMTEISKNAGVYGFDAVAHPELASFQPFDTETGKIKEYRHDDFIPKSHMSAAVLYVPASGQICLVAQNFATASAVQRLTTHFEKTNMAIAARGGVNDGECPLTSEVHKANIDEQPLLRKGFQILETEPACYLGEDYALTSFRNGSKVLRLKTEDIFVLDTKPEIGMKSIANFPREQDALERALAVSGVRRTDLHWVTTGATLSVPPEVRSSFPQP